MSKKKNKKPKTIGEMTQRRATWEINPVTRVQRDKTKYTRKKKHKNRGDYMLMT